MIPVTGIYEPISQDMIDVFTEKFIDGISLDNAVVDAHYAIFYIDKLQRKFMLRDRGKVSEIFDAEEIYLLIAETMKTAKLLGFDIFFEPYISN